MRQRELDNIVGLHLEWLTTEGTRGAKADLEGLDLSGADFRRKDLSEANLSSSCLWEADFRQATLNGTNLREADLKQAKLGAATVIGANLRHAKFQIADLSEVDLSESDLSGANLYGANLSGANLSQTKLIDADAFMALFQQTVLLNTNFENVNLASTIFSSCDLSSSIGLEKINHLGPSSLDTHTLAESQKLPDVFLKGCGLQDWEIAAAQLYDPGLSANDIGEATNQIFDSIVKNPIPTHDLFISYSTNDQLFVDRLQQELDSRGIRNWRDIHDMPAGPLEANIHLAMMNRTVLIVLSKNSVQSDWVEHEVRKARKFAKEQHRHKLLPIALDESWKEAQWPERLMEQLKEYKIQDFSNWQNRTAFNLEFELLKKGLDLHYVNPTDDG